MKVKIVVLVDNTATQDFLAEYGFSAYLEISGEEEIGILFDTGSGKVLESNMLQAGIDWNDIDLVILSHRHFDHTGGLVKVLENRKVPVIAHPHIFKPNFSLNKNFRDIGLPYPKALLELKGAKFVLIKEPMKILENAIISGEIPGKRENHFFTIENGKIVKDFMLDDMALYIKSKNGTVVLTGCSHAGILNIINYGKNLIGNVDFVIGGLHLSFFSTKKAYEISEKLLKEVKAVAPLHCSGEIIKASALEKGKLLPYGAGIKFKF